MFISTNHLWKIDVIVAPDVGQRIRIQFRTADGDWKLADMVKTPEEIDKYVNRADLIEFNLIQGGNPCSTSTTRPPKRKSWNTSP